MLKIKLYTSLMIAMLLNGCSTVVEPNPTTDESLSPCCHSVDSLPLTQLSLPFQQRQYMDEQQTQLSDDELNSGPALAYRIAATEENVSLQVRSYIEDKQLFAPALNIYDHNWQLLAHHPSSEFNYFTSDLRGLERIEIKLNLDPANHARFLVINSDQDVQGQTLERIHIDTLYAKSHNVMPNKRLPLTAQYTAKGLLEISRQAPGKRAWLPSLETGKTSVLSPNDKRLTGTALEQEQWPVYQAQIDQAIAEGNAQLAANLAQQAVNNGFEQAKDYLIKALSKSAK